METATAAATVPTIVPAANATTSVITATNTINVNQSDISNSHTSISAGNGSTSTTSGSSSNSNINSSNSNSSSSSCSTSSNSSGYGSTTTTPTNNYETHQQQHTPTPTRTPTTPVSIADSPIIPVATVAAVTPYYNEAITTQNLEIQHQQQQQQQQYHHQQQQQQQHHLQQSFQHHQYLQRQQYYAPYDYQQQTPNLSSPTTYNLGSGIPYDISSPTASASGAYVGGQYKSSSLSAINYERNAAAARPVTAASSIYTHQVHTNEQQQPKTVQNLPLHQTHQQQFAKQRTSTSLITPSNTSGSKPQAAATPFYAQPLSQQSNPATFYDNLKHKIPLDYHDTYTNPSSATYHQQQKYYAAAKSQLKDATYGSPALSSKSLYPNTTNYYSGTTVNHGYDKYMYPHATANAFAATGHLTNETSPDTSYRKTAAANNLSSPSWPWGIEYASGNSRTIPPPTTHLPTATVAPTHATYLPSNPSALTRDPYYMHHDKFNVKYDKYSASACPPPYQQTYVSSPASRHHMWPSSHPGPQLTQLNDRHHLATGPTAPPPHALHSSPYFSSNSGSSLNARQSCFSQPYQTQSCYYPTPNRLPLNQAPPPAAQSAAYMTGQQPNGQSSHLNTLSSSCKYGGVVTENVNKLKTPNDLYVTSHYDINNTPLNYGYGSNQIFNPNAHQSLNHGPSSALTHEPLAANPASYTNDLNLTSSNYDSYPAHHYDSHLTAAPLGSIQHSQPQQQPPQYAPTVAKRALLDYRKPIQPQPPPIGQQECYTTLTTANTRDHYNHQELLNTPETTSAFSEYEVNQEVARITSEAIADADKADEEENKNLSLRDFIANWNDDEDEYNNTEDLNFEQTAAVINEVLNEAAPLEPEIQQSEIELTKTLEVFKPLTLKDKPKSSDSSTTDTLNDVDSGQYVNLPDIIIDIEKSNNANNSIASPLSTLTTPSGDGDSNPTLILNNFDVEKELDQLKMQKDEEKLESTKDLIDIKDNCITTPQLSPCKAATTQLSFEDLNLEQPTKTVSTSITTRPMTSQTSSNTDTTTEQNLKDIEGYDSGNSRHSNESAFEKEYETFIHKITSESTLKSTSDSVKAFPETESDFEQNVQDFSKFYKRKRKLKEDELKSLSVVNQNTKKLKTNTVEIVNTSNFPQVYTKKSRNRQLKVKSNMPHKRKPISAYYKIIHSLRRYRLFRIKRVRDYITELKEKHLPLIKRQSIKNYSHAGQENSFNPNSLKTLSILAINTEEFRQRLMLEIEATRDDSLKSEEKHICTDPTCETCEVIKSLMEPESFQNTILTQIEDDLYKIPESLTSTAPLLLEVIPEDIEQIVIAKDVEAEATLAVISNESNFETHSADSDNSATILAVLITTPFETSLSPAQEDGRLISDKLDHQISESEQAHLSGICNNSLHNEGETKSPTPPVIDTSLESKNDINITEVVKDHSDTENQCYAKAKVEDQIENKNLTDLEVVAEKMDFPRQKDEKFEDSNIVLNTKDTSLEKPMNLKVNEQFCGETLESKLPEDTKLSNQSKQQSDTIEDNESFQNTTDSLKSLENCNVNDDSIESDINTKFEKESQSCENGVIETKPENILIKSNSEEKIYTDVEMNKDESAIETISTEPNKYEQDEKVNSESSESDSSSDSDSDTSSDSSDESTDDNKESRKINTDTDSSSDSDSSSESEDENSLDNNINRITVRENVVDQTKEVECKISRKSPIQLINDTDSETKEQTTKIISSDSESMTEDENSIDNNVYRTRKDNVEDSTKEAECKTSQKSPKQLINGTNSETKDTNTTKISLDSESNTEDENSLDNNINRITVTENVMVSTKEAECETSLKSSVQLNSKTKERNTINTSQSTLSENLFQISKGSTDCESITENENCLDNNINRITVKENVVDSIKESECKTSPKSPIQLNNDTDSELKEPNTKNISLIQNMAKISKGSTKFESVSTIKASQTSLEPLEINDSDSEWDDESDEESIEVISESETRSSFNSKKQDFNSLKSFKVSKNLKLSNDDSRLSQSNLENISVTIIENKIGDNKIRLKFTTQVVDKDAKVKDSDSDSNYDYDSETDDDDLDMEGNKRWKCANDTSQVLRASQTLLQNTLEFLHTSESSQHKSNLYQGSQQMPLDFLKSANDPEESKVDSASNQQMPLDFLKSAKDSEESKSDSIVISDDETENIAEHPMKNLQSFQDRYEEKADLTLICDKEDRISIKSPENVSEAKNSEEACDEVNKECLNESVISGINNIEDSENNSIITTERNIPVAVEDCNTLESQNLSNVNKVEIQADSCKEQTIENEFIQATRSEISTKDLKATDDLKQDSEKIIAHDLSLPSPSSLCVTENIPEEIEVTKRNLQNFQQNLEIPEILTQDTINETSNCSLECLSETFETPKEDIEEYRAIITSSSLEDTKLNDCAFNKLTEQASSNKKIIVEYNFSGESDNSNDSLINQQTNNIKAISEPSISEPHKQCSENMTIGIENEVKHMERNENTKDCTYEAKVQSPIQQSEIENNQPVLNIVECSEITESINKYNDDPKVELNTEKFEYEEKCAEKIPHSSDLLNDAENCTTNYVNPETNAKSPKDHENVSYVDDKLEYISENLIVSEPPTNVEVPSDNSKLDNDKEDSEITLSNIKIKENLISANKNHESLISSHRFEENIIASKSISGILNDDTSSSYKPMLDKTVSEYPIKDSEEQSFEILKENVTENPSSDIMEEESEQNDNISEYTTTKNSEQNDSNLELNVGESEISKMDISNNELDSIVSETSLESTLDQTLSHETEQNNTKSKLSRDDNISESLVEEFNLNETPKEIMDEESELNDDISELSSNSFEENIIKADQKILVSEQEPARNETSSTIADRTSSNETDTDSAPTKDDDEISEILSKEFETDHNNIDTEPTSDEDDIPEALPKELNETPSEIIEEYEFDISEDSSDSCEENIIKAASCLLVSEPEPEKSREIIEEYELSDDISEVSSNSCDENIIKTSSCLLVSTPEPELNETSSIIDERTLSNETEENHANSEPTGDDEINETKTKEFNLNETTSEIMVEELELVTDVSEPTNLSCEGKNSKAEPKILVWDKEPELHETTLTNILVSEQEPELHETSSIPDDHTLSNESEQNNTKLESSREDEISEITRETMDEEFELINVNTETSRNSFGDESEQEPSVNEPVLNVLSSESVIDDRTLSNESEQNNTILESTRDEEIAESQNNTNMESTIDDEKLDEELTFSETIRATKDEEFEISEITQETTNVEFEQHDVNSEPFSNSCGIDSNTLVAEQDPCINKSIPNELSSESTIDGSTLIKESEETNTNSETTGDDEIFETLAKAEDHKFSETHIDTLMESTTNNQSSVILNTESKFKETLNKNRSSDIQNQELEIDTISRIRTDDINLETKESTQYEKQDQGTTTKANVQPNLTDPIIDKESTTEDLSGDFYGFKNQSSFEDESGDFHGFEDMEEERRIRREIESLNEDSTANDGFIDSTLNKESHKSSKTSLAESTTSEINELEALEKELSQHRVDEKLLEEDEIETDTNVINPTNKIISTHDIEHIKQMLESDEEPQQDETECHRKSNATEAIQTIKTAQELPDSSSKSSSSCSREILNIKSSVIPKLSDLCRAALNSSLHVNNLTDIQNVPDQNHNDDTPTILVEREVTVEEAFAEMYRQAGVLLSDPEDCDNDTPKTTTLYNDEAQDVLLFNLQEILNSDNDVYVLQCDINDKIINVVEQTNDNDVNVNVNAIEASLEENTERVNTLQFIGIQLDTENSNTQIHILSSDSESEVIILSDDDNESFYEPIKTTPRQERVTIPFINDSDFNNDSLSDISTIHHEEIVPDNLNKFLQEEFYKYLHEKYVQRNISKYFYANRVLKKYKNRFVKKSRQ